MNELWWTTPTPFRFSVSQFQPPSSLWFFSSHSNISRTRGSFSNPNSASVRAMFPVTQGSQTKRHPRKSSSGYFGGGHDRSCPSITRRKYSPPLPIAPVTRGMLFSQIFSNRTPRRDPIPGCYNLGIALGSSKNILERPISDAWTLVLQEPGDSLIPVRDLDCTCQFIKLRWRKD